MKFKEHGIFDVNVEETLLLVEAKGPFNDELIIKYEDALESCIQVLEVTQWHQIITLHQLSMFTPEAEKRLTQTLINRKLRGLINCAVVFKNIEAESLVKAQMSRCYKNANVNHMFFEHIDGAKAWLSAR